MRNLTDKIDVTKEGTTAARREFTSVRNWNAKWRDDIQTGMKLAPKEMHKAWTGKVASVADLKKMRIVLADDRVHILRRTGKCDEKYYADTIAPAYQKAKRDLKRELVDAGKENRIGTEWYDWQAWKRAAAECDEIEYAETKPAPLILPKKKMVQEIAEERSIRQRREEDRLKEILRKIAGG